ncbi:tRNA (adenine(22)-N(1))-methyltransferase TrmK [uncultured Enterococcus sp.]|uniref:tRNA (adenine(22)-N(1))-methyltransferase n=1 Tax=uncultured Enterococcus sp. TaxID=167972 RepID=UPI0025CDAAA9|nr:tRNA (adenine(22)-N(1))-methyltransferase TrmK [uncultured Enterococcus sp.]
MNEQLLSKRLEQVGRFVPKDARLADIGSDHAYLPVALMLKGVLSYAIAGEVVKGPYQSAKRQVEKQHLQHVIDVRLADGLEAITLADKIDTITIAGMGGSLIRSILENGNQKKRLAHRERLILQPNIGEKTLREWLVAHRYKIVDETILTENQKIYEIIVAEPSDTAVVYTPQDLLFGPILRQQHTPTLVEKWSREAKQREYVLTQLQQAATLNQEKYDQTKQELDWIMEELATWS